ncbi:MAG: GTPase, partial [Desulfatiglandales bacterium]
MLPKVVIVGRPNVGKSTLFNRILGERKAIVHDIPNVTRDALMGEAQIKGIPVTLVDTGGFQRVDDEISFQVMDQTYSAVEEAQLVLMVVDSRE